MTPEQQCSERPAPQFLLGCGLGNRGVPEASQERWGLGSRAARDEGGLYAQRSLPSELPLHVSQDGVYESVGKAWCRTKLSS